MKKNKKLSQIDLEEKKFLTSFEKGEWKTVKNINEEKKRARKTATKAIRLFKI